jgi:tetratricopeptide (TPR) repeat protein
MRRLVAALILGLVILATATPAQAGWRCWGGGWRHCGVGWRGCGWRGWAGYGLSYARCRPYRCYDYCYPSYGCGYSYGYGCNYGYSVGLPTVGYYATYQPYGVYYNPQANYVDYHLPAVYQPAELAYGPQAVKQFLGLDRNFALAPLREPPARLPLLGVALGRREVAGARPIVRVANAEARRKAEKYLADGDALFRIQKFHSALQKYKLASSAAPDMSEAYWRQGHAMIATSNFDLAGGAFKRAIALSDDTGRGGFQLNNLYGTAALAKNAHLEALAGHALERSESSDPYFLLGVFLTYDGQRERAEKFFDRAADLAGISGGHIAAFEPVDGPVVASRTVEPPAARTETAVAAILETEI